jgi:hypothetical protein
MKVRGQFHASGTSLFRKQYWVNPRASLDAAEKIIFTLQETVLGESNS